MNPVICIILLLLLIHPSIIHGNKDDPSANVKPKTNTKTKVPLSQLVAFDPAKMALALNNQLYDVDDDYDEAVAFSSSSKGQQTFAENGNQGLYEGDLFTDGDTIANEIEDDIPNIKWPNGIINIAMHLSYSNSFASLTERETNQIMYWIAKLMNVTCLVFESDITANDLLIFSKERPSCSSSLGFQGGHQFIYLGLRGCFTPVRMNEQNEPTNGQYFPVIAHELLHSLGFLHEHSRYDRDEHIDIHFDEIKTHRLDQFPIDKRERQCSHPYDIHSVLHYGPYAFNRHGKPTISFHNKNERQRFGTTSYSKWDIYDVNEMYCPQMYINELAEKLRLLYPDCGRVREDSSDVDFDSAPAKLDEFPWVAHVQTYPISKNAPSIRSATFISDRILLTSASALLRSLDLLHGWRGTLRDLLRKQHNLTNLLGVSLPRIEFEIPEMDGSDDSHYSPFHGPESLKVHLRPSQQSYNIINDVEKQYMKNVKAIYIHPEFKYLGNKKFANNLAVIELEHSVDLIYYDVQPICLPRTTFNPAINGSPNNDYKRCKMASWASTDDKQFAADLFKNEVHFSEVQFCKRMLHYNQNIKPNLCAHILGVNYTEDPMIQFKCKYNEGASIACDDLRDDNKPYELAAVVSWTKHGSSHPHCDLYPWVATDVYTFSTSWLQKLFDEKDLFKKMIEEKCPGHVVSNFQLIQNASDLVLTEHIITIRTFAVRDIKECLQKCCDEAKCMSVNYKQSPTRRCQTLTKRPFPEYDEYWEYIHEYEEYGGYIHDEYGGYIHEYEEPIFNFEDYYVFSKLF